MPALLYLVLTAAPLERAASWLEAFPAEQLRFDAAIGLSQLTALSADAHLRRAFAGARAVADRDADNPLRRFWAADAVGKKPTWPARPGVNLNRPLTEALWCDVHGLRPEALAYLAGAMRDGGGYGSTHALWALTLARKRRCLDDAGFARHAAAVMAELRKAQPKQAGPGAAELDLYGERLLMLVLAGERDAELGAWAAELLRRQNADGSWGPPGGEPYARYHATLVATWALALWQRP